MFNRFIVSIIDKNTNKNIIFSFKKISIFLIKSRYLNFYNYEKIIAFLPASFKLLPSGANGK